MNRSLTLARDERRLDEEPDDDGDQSDLLAIPYRLGGKASGWGENTVSTLCTKAKNYTIK